MRHPDSNPVSVFDPVLKLLVHQVRDETLDSGGRKIGSVPDVRQVQHWAVECEGIQGSRDLSEDEQTTRLPVGSLVYGDLAPCLRNGQRSAAEVWGAGKALLRHSASMKVRGAPVTTLVDQERYSTPHNTVSQQISLMASFIVSTALGLRG